MVTWQVDSHLPASLSPVLLIGRAHAVDSPEPWLQANVCRRRTEKRVRRIALDAQRVQGEMMIAMRGRCRGRGVN